MKNPKFVSFLNNSKVIKILVGLILISFSCNGCIANKTLVGGINCQIVKSDGKFNQKISNQLPEKKPTPTAKCRDGWISYSNSRRGTCSHHGGVEKWLKKVS